VFLRFFTTHSSFLSHLSTFHAFKQFPCYIPFYKCFFFTHRHQPTRCVLNSFVVVKNVDENFINLFAVFLLVPVAVLGPNACCSCYSLLLLLLSARAPGHSHSWGFMFLATFLATRISRTHRKIWGGRWVFCGWPIHVDRLTHAAIIHGINIGKSVCVLYKHG